MTAEATKTGKELARWAADAYRQIDVRKVEHDGRWQATRSTETSI